MTNEELQQHELLVSTNAIYRSILFSRLIDYELELMTVSHHQATKQVLKEASKYYKQVLMHRIKKQITPASYELMNKYFERASKISIIGEILEKMLDMDEPSLEHLCRAIDLTVQIAPHDTATV